MVKLTPKKRDQIAFRRSLVATYRNEGEGITQEEIRAKLEKEHGIKVCRSIISTDLNVLNLGWKETAKEEIADYTADTLGRYNTLLDEAGGLFESAKSDGKAGGNTAGYWHREILETLDRRSKLLGLNKVEKQEPPNVSVKVNNFVGKEAKDLSNAELMELLDDIRRRNHPGKCATE